MVKKMVETVSAQAQKRVIPEWRRAWKWFSVQAMVVSAAIQLGWASLPDDMKSKLPEKLCNKISIVTLFLGIGGRVLQQELEPKPKEDKEE